METSRRQELIEKRYNEMVEQYRSSKHEFDEGSLRIIRDIFTKAYELGFDDGRNKTMEAYTQAIHQVLSNL